MSNEHLIHTLESGDLQARRGAVRTLAEMPAMGAIMERDERDISDAIGPLAVAFFDEDDEIREQAARALANAQRDSQDISAARPALVRGLSDERVDVRRSAVLILRQAVIEGLRATPFEAALQVLLDDPIDEVKWGAADTLVFHLAARQRWPRVAGLLGHPDPDVAQEAAGTLAEFFFRLDYRPVVPALLALLASEPLELRLVAAKAVARRPRDASDLAAAIPVLLQCLANPEGRIRKAAVTALEWAVAGFFRCYPAIQEQSDLRPTDWESLAPVTGALPAIELAASDSVSAVRTGAIKVLAIYLTALPAAELGRYQGFSRLFEGRLESGTKEVQKAAAEALTGFWVRTGRWDQLKLLLTKQPADVRRQVLITLAEEESTRGQGFLPLVPTILGILSGPDTELHYPAQRALGRLEPAVLLDRLESEPINTEAQRELLDELRGKVYGRSLASVKRGIEGKSVADRIDYLTRYLGHKQRAVRSWAAESLWWIGQSEDISVAIDPLIRLLEDRDSVTCCAAATALGDASRYGSIAAAHQRLADLAQGDSIRLRELALRALAMSAESGGDLTAVLPALFGILVEGSRPEERSEAGRVLGEAARAGCDLQPRVMSLVSALADVHPLVRFYSARVLYYALKGGADIQAAVPTLVKTLEDPDQRVVSWAATVLEACGVDASRPA